ncbi:S24 family peptidase [Pyxidicoccus xibeiensis]|uniref:S24 family peptidase n=1 Tax=Pyxidicoccus xibeiensis TaxID=2906759 RepID=UPI0020A6EA3B|nr:S24/S26 family peptidase [Pyxidicoccus xibeiensis]MCP3142182.1 S24/S26 family peptidase [Pyxidicoccus xibeiensis]
MLRESSTPTVSATLSWIPVRGDSMWPSLRAGDLAGVEPLEREPRPGDVVLARFDHALVLHRVRRCEAGAVVLRGDNSPAEDPLLPCSRVLGHVRRVRRGGAVLEAGWDQGPWRLGRWRVAVKWRLAALLGRGGRS